MPPWVNLLRDWTRAGHSCALIFYTGKPELPFLGVSAGAALLRTELVPKTPRRYDSISSFNENVKKHICALNFMPSVNCIFNLSFMEKNSDQQLRYKK